MSVDENIDWVAVRASCSAVCVFEQLRKQVQSDVEKRKAVGDGRSFSFDKGDAGCFSVTSGPLTQHSESVAFVRNGDRIEVTAWGEKIEASLTINNDGQCRLKIRGAEFTLWQVRKMALEKLFFEV